MDEQTALHTAARRYCQERFSEWIRVYKELQLKEGWQVEKRFKSGWDYSDEAYRTFPRYRIAKGIEIEIERLIPSSFRSFSEAKVALVAAAEKAYESLQSELKRSLARDALREEIQDFRTYLQVLNPEDLRETEPLPYRRVLSEDESNRLWEELKRTWGVAGGDWFPLKDGPMPSNMLAFHTDYFERIGGAALIRKGLREQGVSTVFLLQELDVDPEYEIALDIFSPYAAGGAQYSTSNQAHWLIYASHESSVTICGDWLIDRFVQSHPECIERTYQGPYSTSDLRGTWGTA
jgi:hypothetical protein